jgi:hypothetical protein
MTDSDGNQEGEDKGQPFWFVRMLVPSPTTIQKLPPELMTPVKLAVQRAIRLFRSQTLPVPGRDTRLCMSHFDLHKVSADILDVLLEDTRDLSRKVTAEVEGLIDEIRSHCSLEIVGGNDDKDPAFQVQFASGLLGKYWYRHQELDIFDAIELVDKLKEARAKGKSPEDLFRPKAPAPPRR